MIPVELRDEDQVKAGQSFEIERLDRGEYRLKRVEDAPNAGLVDWLLACPVKGFLPDGTGSGENTDDIQPDFR